MNALTISVDEEVEENIAAAMTFFQTKSRSAAIRTSLTLAVALVRTAKNGCIVVRDQPKERDLRIILAR